MVVLQALYFMLPAYFANMAPVFAAKLFGNRWSAPVDGGARWRGKPILGSHKTWRGLIAGIAVAIAAVALQNEAYGASWGKALSVIPYDSYNLFALGLLFGVGALGGDMAKSFVKRRVGVAPGRPWAPWDQLDFVIGALAMVSIVFTPPFIIVALAIIFSPALHIAVNQIGYALGLKATRW